MDSDIGKVAKVLLGSGAYCWRFLSITRSDLADAFLVTVKPHVTVQRTISVEFFQDKYAAVEAIRKAVLEACEEAIDMLDESLGRPKRSETKAGFVRCTKCGAHYQPQRPS